MGIFSKKKESPSELVQLRSLLSDSFKNVQKDTAYILHWLNYFYNRSLQQESQISQLRQELDHIPKSSADIRKIVDGFYSYEPVLRKVRELNGKVDELRNSQNDLQSSHHELARKHSTIRPELDTLKEELRSRIASKKPEVQHNITVSEMDRLARRLEKLESKKATIKEKIIRRITKNSKDYIRSIVLSYIKKYSRITALQLKEMVVEEQGLCSKSSFYRLLEELEEDPEIGVIKKGKEKHYIAKMAKKNY